MNMFVKQYVMVRPAEQTPSGSLYLSRLDMIVRSPKSHTAIFYVYQPPTTSSLFDANILKNALSKILVPFYPMAGRLKMNENKVRYEIDCNAKGALFVEAETTYKLADFGDFRPSADLRKIMIPTCDYSSELSSIPLLMVQVTRFRCGGIALGFAPHHHVADGATHISFFNSLLKLARGNDLIVPPVHDRVHVASRGEPQVKFEHSHEFEPILPTLPSKGLSGETGTTQSLFKLSKSQIAIFKQHVTSLLKRTDNKVSTYAVLAGHVWRSACKARDLLYDQEVKLYIPVDGRSRLKDQTLPQGYCGNVLFFAVCKAKAGDVASKPLWYAASKVQEAVRKMDNEEYLRSSIDYLELYPNLPPPLMGSHKIMYPNLLINSWMRLPFHEADFGWGRPKAFGNCEVKVEGLSFLTSSPNEEDDSLALAINLFALHMPSFEKHLYNFLPIKCNL